MYNFYNNDGNVNNPYQKYTLNNMRYFEKFEYYNNIYFEQIFETKYCFFEQYFQKNMKNKINQLNDALNLISDFYWKFINDDL